MGVSLRRTMRLRRVVQAVLASALALLLLSVIMPPQKAEAAAAYIDQALYVDGTSAGPGGSGFFSTLIPASGDFTVEVWARRMGAGAANTKYSMWGTNDKGLYIYNDTFWWTHDNNTNTDTGIAAPKSGWFSVAVVVTASTKTVTLALNGNTTGWSKSFATLTYSNVTSVFIGIDSASTPYHPFVGLLDQLKVFSSALSDSQLQQSMNLYSNVGITGTPALQSFYSFNANDSTILYPTNGFGGANMNTKPSNSAVYQDVKTIDTTSVPGKTIYMFPRTYLNAEGGWKASANGSASKYEYLAVAGGGGGGGNRGGGGGAGGLVTGQVTMPYNGVFSVVVGAGGYSGFNGGDTKVKNSKGTSALLSATGGGAGGTTLGTSINGYNGGSGGGASLCYQTGPMIPSGGSGTAGQGNAGAGDDSTNCATGNPENRHTGGGGGSGAAGQQGSGGSLNPTQSTSPMTTPNGGAGTSSSISGTATLYAAGGGGAHSNAVAGEGYTVSYQGSGGSGIGGDGAAPGARGFDAAAFTGSGGGGGGWNATAATSLVTGGYGSGGIVYLVATPNASLSVPAGGAILSGQVLQQPTVTVPTGTASITGCSVVDADGNSAGVSVTCTPVSGSGTTATLTDLTFTSGTPLQYYTVIFSVAGFEDIRQEMFLGYQAASITIASASPTSNFVWDGSVLLATSANQAVTVLGTDVQSKINSASAFLAATGAINVNNGFTSTTSGNGITFKGLTYSQIASGVVTTANGPVTLWITNPDTPTGTTGTTGVKLDTSAKILTQGGAITIGGGANPLTDPLTAEVGVKMASSSQLQAAGGNISILARTVLNSNLNTADDQMVAVALSGSNTISTTGSASISISTTANGPANGRRAGGIEVFGSTSTISAVNGNINLSATNAGSGTILPIAIGSPGTSDASNTVSTSGAGNITMLGDGRGATTTSTTAPFLIVYGVELGKTYGSVSTVSGNISITGKAGSFAPSTVSSNLNSVGIGAYASKIISSGSGTVTLSGTGGNIGPTTSTFYASSIGVDSTSWIGATTGDVNITATSGSVDNTFATQTSNVQYGFRGQLGSLTHATYNDGAILTTTGNINVTADTGPVPTGAIKVTAYGSYLKGHKIQTTGGNITWNSSVCSSCSGPDGAYIAMGLSMMTDTNAPTMGAFTTAGSGSISISGHVDHSGNTTIGAVYGAYLNSDSASRNIIVTDVGNISISGSQAGSSLSSYGLYLYTGGVITNAGAVTIAGATNNPLATVTQNFGIYAYQWNTTGGTGDVTVTGTTDNPAKSNTGVSLFSSNITTSTGDISIDGEETNATAGVSHIGTFISTSSITSGNSSTLVTGGTISVVGKTTAFTTGSQSGGALNGSTVNTYNNEITMEFNTASSVSNGSNLGLNITGTVNLAATASSLNLTVNSGATGNKGFFFDNNSTLNLGGANSNAAITVNSNNFGRASTSVFTVNIDTDGDVNLRPIDSSFWMDMFNTGSPNTAVMNISLVPSSRVRNLTIGKAGNTRALTLSSAFNLDSTSGQLKIFSGDLVSTAKITAPTLAVQSTGAVTLSNAANAFTNVAVVRGSATGWNLVNVASSWTAGTYGGITGVYGVPSKLKASGTPPSTVALGSNLAAYSVIANDGYDMAIAAANTRSADALSVTASVKSGATATLGGTATQTGTAGAAIAFNDLSFTNAGVHTLAFDATNFTQYVSPNITVSGGTPTLYLSYAGGTNATTFVSASTTLSPTFSSNNTSAKVYTSLTTAVCTVVSSTGVVTTKTPGTCTIKVDQVADSTYLAGTATVNITIDKMAQAALTITSTSGSFGSVLTLATSGGNAGAVTYVVDSGTCTLATATTLNLGAVGSACAVTATRAGDATYATVSSVSTSIATNKGNQASLVTPATTNMAYQSAGLDLTALTITGGSGNGSIGFSTSTTGCSINGTTLTSTNSVGVNCVVTATKAGDADYNTGTGANFTVTLVKATQAALSLTSTSATYGIGLALTYAGGSGNGAISYSFVSGSCTVSSSTLTPTAATSCVVKVTKAADTNYNAATSADTTVTIAKGTQAAITITSTSGTYGSALILTTTGGSNNGSYSYVVDSGTCSLATANTLNLGAVGDACSITATKASTADYNSVSSVSTSIATVKANQTTLVAPTGVTLTYANSTGLSLSSVAFTGGSGTGSLAFSTATAGCSIASNVLTSTNNAATTCVVATTKAADSNYNVGNTANLTVTIAKANQDALVISTTTGTYGSPLTLATTGGSDAGAVTFSKVPGGACTLASGVLTLGYAGTSCTVTATKAATANYNAVVSASTSIITNKANQATLTITTTSGTFNTVLALTTSGGTDNGAVTYAVDSGTCVLSGRNLTLGNVGDSCMVTATKAATDNYNVATSVSTSISTGRAAQAALVAPAGTNLTFGDTNGVNLTTLTFTGGSGTGSLIFSTSTSGCVISGSNVLTSTNNAATTCVVATNKAGDSNFSAGTAVNLTVTIVKANQSTLTITSTSATYPTTLPLTTSGGDGDGALSYSVVSGACTISVATLTPTGAGSCVIRVTKATSTNYNATTSADATVSIARGTQSSVSITSSSSIAYASTITLTATGGSSGATGYVFATSTTGCTVSGTTLSTTLGASNNCSVTAYKAGDSNWTDSNTDSQTVTVIKASQVSAQALPTGVTLTYNNQAGVDLTTLGVSGGSGTGAYVYTATTAGCNIASDVLTTANLANTSCAIDVVKAADANYNSLALGTLSIAIVAANQPTIVVTTTSATFGQTLIVQYTGGVGTGAVTYSATGTCSVDSSGVLSVTAAGATGCSVTVAKAAEANKYNEASSTAVTVAVAKGTQAAVSFTSGTTIEYAGTLALTASGGSSTASGYVFSTSTTNCSISGSTLSSTLPATNSCAISVYKTGDANWFDSAAATSTITIAKANQAAVVVPSGTNLTYGDANGINLAGLTITGGSGNGSFSFTSSTSGCSISSATLTSTNDAGTTCTIVTTKAADANYNASNSVNLTVNITKANQPSITVISLSANYPSVMALTASGGAGTGALTYALVSGPCTISGANLTPTGAGSCVINVTSAADTNYNATTSANATVAIAKGTQSAVSITSSTSLEYSGSLTLTASGGSSGATGYVFATSTTGCSVTGNLLSSTLGAANTCAVSAYKAADTNWDASGTATQAVTIIKASQVTTMSVPSGVTLTYASTGLDLTTLTFSGGNGTGAYTFTTSTIGCTISGSNVLTSTNNAATNCAVDVVKAADANFNASPAGTMQVAIVKANQAAISVSSLAATFGANLTLTATGGTSNGAITFAKVSGSCTIAVDVLTPTGAGNCLVTATMAGGTNYNNVTSANATVVIAKANQAALVLNMANSVPYLASLALTTTGGSGTGNVVFSVTQNSVCSITGTNLTPLDVGSTCEVLATKLGDANYNSVDATGVQITTTPINQAAITFNSASVMTYGSTLAVSAIGGSGTGNIAYSVNNAGTTGCALTGSTLSVTASGTCVVSAVKAASNNYNIGASVNQSITVNKAAQTTTFTSQVPNAPMVGSTYTVTATSTSGTAPTFTIASGSCTIAAAVVTFNGTGNCRIDANTATTNQYLAAAVVWQTVAVGQRNQVLTFDAATLAVTSKTFGDPSFAAVATSSITGLTPVYSRGAATTNNACLVSTSGLVTVVAVGVCQIQADQPGDANTAAATPQTLNFNVVADVANAPTIVSVSAGHQAITAAFVKPSYTGGAAVTGYQMVAIHAGGQETFSGCPVVVGNDQSCTISGLTNGTSYTIKVAAINTAGVGLQSAASASRVPATNPAAVTTFTAVPDNTTLQLSWGLPISLGGGTFDSYRIFIKPSTDANYPTTYTSLNSMATLGYQFTNLINGQAYDAMIVTVTTANTLALVSNTAEVRETPRTVPDAPASILIFEVGANLVISWTSPIADGGNAISEYAASIGGAPCVLATPIDTTCSITTPTSAGDYPIEVKAKNSAGFGQAVTGNFTKIAAVVPAPPVVVPGNGGNEYVANPRIPMLVLGISSSKASTAGGTVLTFTAKNMDKLTDVLVSGIKAKIISASKTQVKIQMPKHAVGPVTIHFVSPNGTLDLVDAVVYVTGTAKASKVTIKNFIQENATLNTAAKKSLKTALTAGAGAASVTCVGYQSWSYDRPIDAKTALQRAQTACRYLKSLDSKLLIKSVVARTSLTGPASRKLEVIFK